MPTVLPPPRLWSKTSAWNMTIPSNCPSDPNSDHLVQRFCDSLKRASGMLMGGIGKYGAPYGVSCVLADPSTPTVNVAPANAWWGGFPAMPLPVGADPSPGGDHHLAVLMLATGTLWELWQAVRVDATHWKAGAGIRFDVGGKGYLTGPYPAGMTSARAYGGSVMGGVVTLPEARHYSALGLAIPHALAIATDLQRFGRHPSGTAGGFQSVASAHPTGQDRDTDDYIADGARFQLLMTDAEIDAEPWSSVAKSEAKAAARSGVIHVDGSGGPEVFHETRQGQQEGWDGVPGLLKDASGHATGYDLLTWPTDPKRWRLLAMPPMTTVQGA